MNLKICYYNFLPYMNKLQLQYKLIYKYIFFSHFYISWSLHFSIIATFLLQLISATNGGRISLSLYSTYKLRILHKFLEEKPWTSGNSFFSSFDNTSTIDFPKPFSCCWLYISYPIPQYRFIRILLTCFIASYWLFLILFLISSIKILVIFTYQIIIHK